MSTLDDPLVRSKWMNVKKALTEETEVVKQLDSEKRSFKDGSMGRRPSSPPISANKSSFVFEPLDEYPTSSNASFDDPDVWRPPSRDTSNRRSARVGAGGSKKSPQDGAWARGSTTRGGSTARGGKAGGSSRANPGARASTTGKKGSVSGKPNTAKDDSGVRFTALHWCSSEIFWYLNFYTYLLQKVNKHHEQLYNYTRRHIMYIITFIYVL